MFKYIDVLFKLMCKKLFKNISGSKTFYYLLMCLKIVSKIEYIFFKPTRFFNIGEKYVLSTLNAKMR